MEVLSRFRGAKHVNEVRKLASHPTSPRVATMVELHSLRSDIKTLVGTNTALKNQVQTMVKNAKEMGQQAMQQDLTISSLKRTHEKVMAIKEKDIEEKTVSIAAQKTVHEAIAKLIVECSQALNIIIKEQQDTASMTEELLLETRSDLTSSKAETAKLREELKTLRAELLMRENDMCQMEELYEKQKKSLQQIHRKEVQALTEGFEQEMQERNQRERFLQEMIARKNTEIKEVKKEMATMKDIHEEEVKALKESFLQVNKDRDDKERLLQHTILLKNEEVASLRKDMTASKDIHEEEVKALKESFLQVNKDRDDKERLLQQTILQKNEEVAVLKRNMKAEKDIHEEELKELQQTIRLDSLFVKDLMVASSKIESGELEVSANV
ncbi:uncharacterized protein LOC144874056 [Branchiostoma floridae x Branchiostoma japonicum]